MTLQKSLLAFLLPAPKMQLSLYQLYTSFQFTRSRWLLTIHRLFRPSPILLLVAVSGTPCTQPTIFPKLNTCQVTDASAFLNCTNFKTGSKLPDFSGIVVSASASQYPTKALSLFRSLILNGRCSYQGRRPVSVP